MAITHATTATGTDAGTGEIHKAEWNAAHVGAIPPLEQHTASSQASLDFTTSISSTYDEYLIELVNVLPATSAADLIMRMSTNGGSSYDSGSNYACVGYRNANDGATWDGQNPSGATTSLALTVTGVNTDAHYGVTGHIRLFSPGSTTVYKTIVGDDGWIDTQGTPHLLRRMFYGTYLSTTAVDAFQFKFSSGNITSGTIRVYGIAK